jgi:integrase
MGREQRPHGDGTIRRRPDGRWEGKLAWLLPSGELYRKSVYGKTQKEAGRKLKDLAQQVRQNTVSLNKLPTLAKYLEGWMHDDNLKPSSLENRELNIRGRIVPVLGGIRIDKVTPNHVRQLLDALEERSLSGSSQLQAWVYLNKALEDAVIQGLISNNPFTRVPKSWKPKPAPPKQRILNTKEQMMLLALNDGWTPLWKLQLATGMRSGEALGLQWKYVDLQAGRIKIEYAIQRDRQQQNYRTYRLVRPKTKNSRRVIAITPLVKSLLEGIKASQEYKAKRLGEAWSNPEGFVFTRYLGEPVFVEDANYGMVRSLKMLNIEKKDGWDVHALRHTFATDLLNNGAQMAAVSKILGHSDVAFTIRTYAHVLEGLETQVLQDASRMLEETMRLIEWEESNAR